MLRHLLTLKIASRLHLGENDNLRAMNWRLLIYPVRMNRIGCVSCGICFFYLPGADAFGHRDDVAKAGRGLHLGSRAHRHGNKLLCQCVAYLYKGNQYLNEPISRVAFLKRENRMSLLQSTWITFRMEMQWDTRPLEIDRDRQTDNQRGDERTADKCHIMLILCIIIIMAAEKDAVKRPYEASSIHSSFSRMASMCGLVMTTSSSSNSDGSLWVSIAPIRSTVGLRGEMSREVKMT